jgi:carbon storage regulator CsrA
MTIMDPRFVNLRLADSALSRVRAGWSRFPNNPSIEDLWTVGRCSLNDPSKRSREFGSQTRKGDAMLVLTRRVNEEIIIDGRIRVRVLDAHRDRVRIGVDAPPEVRVDRLEVQARRTASDDFEAPFERSSRLPPADSL